MTIVDTRLGGGDLQALEAQDHTARVPAIMVEVSVWGLMDTTPEVISAKTTITLLVQPHFGETAITTVIVKVRIVGTATSAPGVEVVLDERRIDIWLTLEGSSHRKTGGKVGGTVTGKVIATPVGTEARGMAKRGGVNGNSLEKVPRGVGSCGRHWVRNAEHNITQGIAGVCPLV